jgi:hypothetical protein
MLTYWGLVLCSGLRCYQQLLLQVYPELAEGQFLYGRNTIDHFAGHFKLSNQLQIVVLFLVILTQEGSKN